MKVVRIVLGVTLWACVLGLTGILLSFESTRNLVAASTWLSSGTVIQLMMLIASLVLILALSRGKFALYGFRMATRGQIKTTFVIGSIAAVVVHVMLAILLRLVSTSAPPAMMNGGSLLQVVVSVWIVASICEEVLHRGLIQSFLDPLKGYGITIFGIRFSLPVVTVALLFGFMHIVLLTTGVDGFLVGCIVGSSIVLGMVAGYYREKSGSLLPAILVHMLFNAYGGVAQYIQRLPMR